MEMGVGELAGWLVALGCVVVGVVGGWLWCGRRGGWWFGLGMLGLAGERLLDMARLAGVVAGPWWWWTALVPGVWLGFARVFGRAGAAAHARAGWVAAALGVPLGLAVVVGAVGAGGWLLRLWVVVLLVVVVAVLATLERTLRGAQGMARWRVKYVVLGLAVVLVVRLYTLTQWLLFGAPAPRLVALETLAAGLGCLMLALGVWRTSSRPLEIYPSCAVLHGSFTLVLAGSYFLAVGVLAHLVARLGGSAAFPLQALVLLLGGVGLGVLLLSERVRSVVRRGVSRHFRRGEYDFRRIWGELTGRMACVLDARELGEHGAAVVAETFRVLGVTVCRLEPGGCRLTCLASTGDRRAGESLELPVALGVGGVGQRWRRPFNLEGAGGGWAAALRGWCARKFPHGGPRWVVPLVACEQLVGLLVLSDRVNGVGYSEEELDLLACVGDQLAGALLNNALAEEVMQAKQLEAFQTLSTFFVHDLKNAANSLGLMLRNLPVHFDDAEFRADAVRGIGRTVERINQLTGKLGNLRESLCLRPEACRLSELCAEVLDAEAPCVRRELALVPSQPLDREALKSVVRNLVGNAREAVGPGGQVVVATRALAGAVELSVSDDGCGMSEEFVRESLFRPFCTTKAGGLGIGLFQCRKIIDAHGGRITVESTPGRGTRVRVTLPLAGAAVHFHEAESTHH